MTSKPFFQNTFILRKPGLVNFADIIKTAIMLIKTTIENSIKVKENQKLFIEMQSLSVFPDINFW